MPIRNDRCRTQSVSFPRGKIGRYCLNDLHKASGGADAHAPAKFFRLDSAEELVNELLSCTDVSMTPLQTSKGGANKGTYVVKELVYAYAMWISPKFHLKVIRF